MKGLFIGGVHRTLTFRDGTEKGKEYTIAHIVFELGNIVETFKGEK